MKRPYVIRNKRKPRKILPPTQLMETVAELRKSGLTFDAIGKKLGSSRQNVHQAWKSYHRLTEKRLSQPLNEENL